MWFISHPFFVVMYNMYQSFSDLYEKMYQTFINYDEEYIYYSGILKDYHHRSLVELGCGTGSLASHFIKEGYDYSGLDLSPEMLAIAQNKNPGSVFIPGDIRSFKLKEKTESCIMPGRTISYLLSNQEVVDCFNSIHENLKKEGIFCFDCIDAEKFIPTINLGKQIRHEAEFNSKKFIRKSFWSRPDNESNLFKWKADFFEEHENGHLKKIGEDESILRTFSKNEIILFLKNCNFKVEKLDDRPSYAFETFVVVAQKNLDYGNV